MRIKFVLGVLLVLLATLGASAAPASAQVDYVSEAARALRDNPVYVHWAAEPTIGEGLASDLRNLIRQDPAEVFIAVLPADVIDQVGYEEDVPLAILDELEYAYGIRGTIGVIAGEGFWTNSTSLPTNVGGELGDLALEANFPIDAEQPDIRGMLTDFVLFTQDYERQEAGGGFADTPGPTAAPRPSTPGKPVKIPWGMIGIGAVVLLAFGAAVVIGLLVAASKRREQEATDAAAELTRRLQSLSDDILAYGDRLETHPQAKDPYERAVLAYQQAKQLQDMPAQSTMEAYLDRAEAEMADARAYLEGRDPVAERAEAERVAAEKAEADAEAERLRRASMPPPRPRLRPTRPSRRDDSPGSSGGFGSVLGGFGRRSSSSGSGSSSRGRSGGGSWGGSSRRSGGSSSSRSSRSSSSSRGRTGGGSWKRK